MPCFPSPAPFPRRTDRCPRTVATPCTDGEFIQAGAAATAAAATLLRELRAAQVAGEQAGAAKKNRLTPPGAGQDRRPGDDRQCGNWRAPDSLDRLLRHSFLRGVRYFDTAAGYHTEDRFKAWFAAQPEVRKQIFLATKDHVREPGQMVNQVDERLAALGTDYIDLLFFHGLGSDQVDWPKSKEMKEAIEAVKKTGKVRFVGFSTHDRLKAEQIQAAAEGGFVDVIMLAFTPWLAEGRPDQPRPRRRPQEEHRAGLDEADGRPHAGQEQRPGAAGARAQHAPGTAHRHLVRSADLRHLRDHDEYRPGQPEHRRGPDVQATEGGRHPRAARRRPGRRTDDVRQLRRQLRPGRRHQRAPGRPDPFPDLPRAPRLRVSQAREDYAELTEEERNWHGADLEAAREACHSKLNFAQLLPEVDRLLG